MTKQDEAQLMVEDFVETSKRKKYDEDIPTPPPSPKPDENKKCKTPAKNRKRWILLALTYSNFWSAACVSLQAPFFPREAENKGASATEYGFIFGIFELVVVFISPVYASMMPRVKPRFLVISGVALEGAACISFGLLDKIPAGSAFIGLAFFVRIIEGIAAAAISTGSFTIIASEFQESVATSFSMMEVTYGVGLIVGPTIGGILYQLGGFTLPFVVCGMSIVTSGFPLYYGLPRFEEKLEPEPPGDCKAFLFYCDTLMYAFAIITSFVFVGFNSATLEPHLRQFGLQPSVLGVVFVVSGLIYAFTTPIWGRICDKGGEPHIICIAGYVMVAIGVLFIGPVPFIPLQPTLLIVICSLIISGLGMAAKLASAFSGTLKGTIDRGFPNNVATFSMVAALFSSSFSAGAFVGPTIGGLLMDNIGYRNATLVILCIESFFLAAMVIHMGVRWYRNKVKNPEKSPLLRTINGERDISNG